MKLERDKVGHIVVGAGIAIGTSLVCGLWALLAGWDAVIGVEGGSVLGTILGVWAGVLKEEYDRKRPDRHTKDGWDATATGVGAATAGAAMYATVLAWSLMS